MKQVKNTEFAADVAELTASYSKKGTTRSPMERPAVPVEGDIWFDTTEMQMHVYVGGKWVDIPGGSPL